MSSLLQKKTTLLNLDLDACTERVQRKSQARLRAEKNNNHALSKKQWHSAAQEHVEKRSGQRGENLGAQETCG